VRAGVSLHALHFCSGYPERGRLWLQADEGAQGIAASGILPKKA